jgi:hypothetical protein
VGNLCISLCLIDSIYIFYCTVSEPQTVYLSVKFRYAYKFIVSTIDVKKYMKHVTPNRCVKDPDRYQAHGFILRNTGLKQLKLSQ